MIVIISIFLYYTLIYTQVIRDVKN